MKSRSSRPGLAREAVIGQIRVASGVGRGSPRPPRGCPGYNPKHVPRDPRLCPPGRPPPALPLGSSLGPPRREGSRPPSSGSAGAEHPHGRGCLWRPGHRDQGSRSSLGGAENEPAPGGRGAHAGKLSRESAVASGAPASARLRLPAFSLCVELPSRLNSSSSSIFAGELLPCTSVPRVELSVPPRRRRRPRQDLALLTWVSSSPQTSALHPGNPRPSLRSARRVSWARTAGRKRLHIRSRGRVCDLQKQHHALNLILPFTQQNASKP